VTHISSNCVWQYCTKFNYAIKREIFSFPWRVKQRLCYVDSCVVFFLSKPTLATFQTLHIKIMSTMSCFSTKKCLLKVEETKQIL